MDPSPPTPTPPTPPPPDSPPAPPLLDFPPAYSEALPPAPAQPLFYPVPRPPPRVWTVFVAFAVALGVGIVVAGLVALAVAVALEGPGVMEGPDRLEAVLARPPVLLSSLFATQVVLTGVALSGALLSPTPLRRRLRLGAAVLPWYGYGVVVLGTVALAYTSSIVIEMLGLGDQGVLEEFERSVAGMRGALLVLAAAVIGLAPGLGEELLFRGYIQTRLRQRWPRLLALAITSLLFGIIHLDPIQGTFAMLMGLWLGEVTDRAGSIWPAVVAHTVNNAGATVLGALAGAHEAGETAPIEAPWFLIVSLPLLALCLLYVLRRPVLPPEEPPEAPLPPGLTAPLPPAEQGHGQQ